MIVKKTLLFFLFALAAFASLVSQGAHAQVAVIANPSVKATAVSKGELGDVFTGAASSLSDGSHVVPVLLKGGAANDAFLSEFVGKSDAAFRTAWRSLVFTGQGSMPKTVDSEAAMVEYVAATPGAIGYVGKDVAHDKVKTLTVK
jgi:ABC-type phosphate transport system substrate-binding protein